MAALYQLTGEIASVLATLDDGEADGLLIDRLDALQVARDQKLAGCSAARRNLVANVAGIDTEIERLKRLQAKANAEVDRLEDYMRADLERLGETKFAHPVLGFSIRKNPPSVVIEDGTELPPEYVRREMIEKVSQDKAALMALFKSGGELPAGVQVRQRTRLYFQGE